MYLIRADKLREKRFRVDTFVVDEETMTLVPIETIQRLAQASSNLTTEILRECRFQIESDDGDLVLQGLQSVRILLVTDEPPIDEVIDSGILTRLVDLLRNPGASEEIKSEIAWIFTNCGLGTTEQLRILQNVGIVEALMS